MQGRVLITGIDSFTGTHLEADLKKRGFDVFGTVLGAPKKENQIQCNIVYQEQIDAAIAAICPSYIIHVAAVSFVGEADAALTYQVNVCGTDNLLQALGEHKKNIKKIIVVSSATVYGNQGCEVLTESMCPQPVNHYGISKLGMEFRAKTYFDNLPIIITRPFNYTGIGQAKHFLIPKIVRAFKNKEEVLELGNLHVSREFNAVDFVCDTYARLLESDASSTIVNIASQRGVKLLDVIAMMNEIAGYQIKVRTNPKFVRKDEIPLLTGSKEKLERLIGKVSNHSLQKTLQKMYEA